MFYVQKILKIIFMIQALGGNKSKYSKIEVQETEGRLPRSKAETIEKKSVYTMIMAGHPGSQKMSEKPRYCAGHFEFKRTTHILLVSFHGNKNLDAEDLKLKKDPRFKDITEANQIKAIKQFRLGEYLKIFHKLKIDNKCHHLIVGGDFNLNVDKLLVPDEIRAQSPTLGQLLLEKRQEDFIELFNRLDLQIVPYNSQKRKYEALICDSGLSNAITATVYIKEAKKDKAGNILKKDGDTFLEHFKFSKNSLDHDPLLFTIKMKVPTTEVQLPTTKVQLPTTEVQLPTTEVQVPTTEVQVPTTEAHFPTTEEDVLADELRRKMNLKTDPTNPNQEVNFEASGSSLEGTSLGTIPKRAQKK
jgi:hypothetical protein